MKWTSLAAPLALLPGLVMASGALASGGPVAPVQGSEITVAGSPYGYTAAGAGRDTVVKRFAGAGGPLRSELRLSGRYGIPGADYGGSLTGLSADGHTLVLAELLGNPPPRTTRLLVVNTPGLTVRARLSLPGWSTVDAISPDGRWLYLIHYRSSNITKYEVRAYDLVTRRFLARPIVDPHDRGEAMNGVPMTRVMSVNGRWAYTLYARPSGVPFVHALDTVGRRAVCIDLPSVSTMDIGTAHLVLTAGGATLGVQAPGMTQTLINTRTFAVHTVPSSSAPAPARRAPARAAAHVRRGTRDPGVAPWELILLSIAALMIAAIVASVARPGRPGRHARVMEP